MHDHQAADAERRRGSPAAAILARLSLAEKVSLLHQRSPGVERLGLAPFRTGTEALHGLAWLGVATVFPQPVGLAASWDPGLLRLVGAAVAVEVRAKHAEDPSVSLNVWAPVVNPLRHPLWGRNEEGYSEDPDLTAALAAAYAGGLRGQDPDVWLTVPTLKHALGYGNETDRAATSSHLPPQALREYELPAFTGPLRAGAVGAIMPSYNLVNGRPAHLLGDLLAELRAAAPHSLAIVSDAQAPSNLVDGQGYVTDHVTSHALALRAGVDSFTENDADAGPTIERITAALAAGLLTETDIDAAAGRLLDLRERTGELGATRLSGVPGEGTSDEHRREHTGGDAPGHARPERRALARETVARSVVLLANDRPALPLPDAPASIAVVGPYADHAAHDWYSGTPPYLSTIATAVAERYPGAEVRVADGAERVALRALSVDRYLTVTAGGATVAARAVTGDHHTHLDVTDWGEGVLTLRSVGSGRLLSAARWICSADAERIGGWQVQESFRSHRHDDGSISLRHIASGRWLRVQHGTGLLVAEGDAGSAERFAARTVRSGLQEVARVCEGAEAIVVALGNDPHLLGRETEDRPHLRVPESAREIWRTAVDHSAGTAAGAPVLALVSSYPYAVAAEAAVAGAVAWTSHGGQELGRGLVDVLSGDVEPSGRLPQTWWRDAADAGDLLEYDVVGAGMTYRYSPTRPLYGLGHGLGYSRVSYDAIAVAPERLDAPAPTLHHTPARFTPDAGSRNQTHEAEHGGEDADEPAVEVLVTVTNRGNRPAHELVAVYALAPELPVVAPRVRLAGWRRVLLAPGERREVSVRVGLGVLAVWDVAADAGQRLAETPGAFVVQNGSYRLASGPSAAELTVSDEVYVAGGEARVRAPESLAAHGFHASHAIVTSDAARERGSCVELYAAAAQGWIRYDRLDLAGVRRIALHVAPRDLPSVVAGELEVEIRRSRTGDAKGAGTAEVADDWRPLGPPVRLPRCLEPAAGTEAGAHPSPPTRHAVETTAQGACATESGGEPRYDWREVVVPIDPSVAGLLTLPVDLRVWLRGATRLARIELRR